MHVIPHLPGEGLWILSELPSPPLLLLPSSTASSTSQCAWPDLNRKLQISATAGPKPQAPDLSTHYWTSTTSVCMCVW